MPNKSTPSDCKSSALNILSRRDHSYKELESKLRAKGFMSDVIAEALSYCAHLGYLDDERYARLSIEQQIRKGRGLLRIRQELKMKGVDQELVNTELNKQDCDWFELAYLATQKRAEKLDLSDIKQKNRLFRQLLQLGFTFEQINYAIESLRA